MQDPTHSESSEEALADYPQWVIWLVLLLSTMTLAACGHQANASGGGSPGNTIPKTEAPVAKLSANEQAIVIAIARLPVNGTYPKPVLTKKAASLGVVAGCPSTSNLARAATLTPGEAAALENSVDVDLSAKNLSFIRDFDRTLLDLPRNGFAQLFGQNLGTTVTGSFTAADISSEPLVADRQLANSVSSACGSAAMQASWRIVFCNPNTVVSACNPGITTTELAIDRSGKWLIWYLGSGLQ